MDAESPLLFSIRDVTQARMDLGKGGQFLYSIDYSQKSNLVTCPIFHISAECNQIPKCNLNFDLQNKELKWQFLQLNRSFSFIYRYIRPLEQVQAKQEK